MQAVNFEETLDKILQRDPRYKRDAYQFVRDALDYTQKIIVKSGREGVHHVTGQELLAGIRSYVLEQFGPMTLTVLHDWGIHSGEDFGEIVFNMVESSLLAKTENDSRTDFKDGYDFEEAFRHPYLPAKMKATHKSEPKQV